MGVVPLKILNFLGLKILLISRNVPSSEIFSKSNKFQRSLVFQKSSQIRSRTGSVIMRNNNNNLFITFLLYNQYLDNNNLRKKDKGTGKILVLRENMGDSKNWTRYPNILDGHGQRLWNTHRCYSLLSPIPWIAPTRYRLEAQP